MGLHFNPASDVTVDLSAVTEKYGMLKAAQLDAISATFAWALEVQPYSSEKSGWFSGRITRGYFVEFFMTGKRFEVRDVVWTGHDADAEVQGYFLWKDGKSTPRRNLDRLKGPLMQLGWGLTTHSAARFWVRRRLACNLGLVGRLGVGKRRTQRPTIALEATGSLIATLQALIITRFGYAALMADIATVRRAIGATRRDVRRQARIPSVSGWTNMLDGVWGLELDDDTGDDLRRRVLVDTLAAARRSELRRCRDRLRMGSVGSILFAEAGEGACLADGARPLAAGDGVGGRGDDAAAGGGGRAAPASEVQIVHGSAAAVEREGSSLKSRGSVAFGAGGEQADGAGGAAASRRNDDVLDAGGGCAGAP